MTKLCERETQFCNLEAWNFFHLFSVFILDIFAAIWIRSLLVPDDVSATVDPPDEAALLARRVFTFASRILLVASFQSANWMVSLQALQCLHVCLVFVAAPPRKDIGFIICDLY